MSNYLSVVRNVINVFKNGAIFVRSKNVSFRENLRNVRLIQFEILIQLSKILLLLKKVFLPIHPFYFKLYRLSKCYHILCVKEQISIASFIIPGLLGGALVDRKLSIYYYTLYAEMKRYVNKNRQLIRSEKGVSTAFLFIIN